MFALIVRHLCSLHEHCPPRMSKPHNRIIIDQHHYCVFWLYNAPSLLRFLIVFYSLTKASVGRCANYLDQAPSKTPTTLINHSKMGKKSGNQQRTTKMKGVTSGSIKVTTFLNLLSIGIYAVEWYKSGEVMTTSGAWASGHHKGPVNLAFLTYIHQVFFNKGNGWHH